MGVSNCARITSLFVHAGLVFDVTVLNSTLPVSYPLADFPLLRKLDVTGFFFRPKNEKEDAILRCIRVNGVEVDCIDRDFGCDQEW